MLYVLTKIKMMKTKEKIYERMEEITKRIVWLENRLYYINPAKNYPLFKQHSDEKSKLIDEREMLLAQLNKML